MTRIAKRKPQKRLPPHAFYVQRCILFSVSGRWPLPFAERQAMYARESAVSTGGTGKGTNKLRRDWGTFAQPQQPASSLARQSCGDGEAVPGKARLDVSEVRRRHLAAATAGQFSERGDGLKYG